MHPAAIACPIEGPAVDTRAALLPLHLDSYAGLPFVEHAPHVLVDAVGGAMLGVLAVGVYLWLLRRMDFSGASDSTEMGQDARSTAGRRENQ